MEQTLPRIEGELTINPSPTSSSHDFDFFPGKWRIHNRKLKTRLNNCTEWLEFEAEQEVFPILKGIGNMDFFRSGIGQDSFEGMTLRLFNPKTRLWSIYWADSNAGVLDPPVVGSFENGIGRFYGRDIFNEKEILVVFNWDASDPNAPIWSQAFSDNAGKSWEWNWYMYMKRV
jgi:hypothetical protein